MPSNALSRFFFDFVCLFVTEATQFCVTAGSILIQISAIKEVRPIPYMLLDFNLTLYIFRILRPGESTVTMFDVVQEFFTDLWDNWFGERSSSNWNYLRILKKRSLQQKQVNKRDIVLPSFGIAGEIVNDMANSAINAATVWKYQ